MMQNISKIVIESYRQLHNGLSDMIEEGRLSAADIPDDYQWLADMLATIAGLDPTTPAVPARPDLPKGLSAADDPHLILSHYKCPECGAEWADIWDSGPDDECDCGATVSPAETEDCPDCQCQACRDDRAEILSPNTGDTNEP